MNNDYKSLLGEMLRIVGYEGDVSMFMLDFEKKIQTETISRIIKSLPDEEKMELEKIFSIEGKDLENLPRAIKARLGEEMILGSLRDTATDFIVDYVNYITPNLSDDRRQNLTNLLHNYSRDGLVE